MSKAIGALLFVLAILVLFVVGFGLFLFLPFFLFIGGVIAMIVSDRNRSEAPPSASQAGKDGPAIGENA